jgi:hypothetical protein
MIRGTRWAFLFGAPIYLAFAIPDWQDYHDSRVIAIRVVVVMCFCGLFVLLRRPMGQRHPYALAFVGFLIASISLDAIMILKNDIPDNAEGFGFVTFLFCLFIPATMPQASVACTVFVGLYAIPAIFDLMQHSNLNVGGVLILVIGTAAGIIKTWWDQREASQPHPVSG